MNTSDDRHIDDLVRSAMGLDVPAEIDARLRLVVGRRESANAAAILTTSAPAHSSRCRRSYRLTGPAEG